VTIQSVTYIGSTFIRLNLGFFARVDATYGSASNYNVSVFPRSTVAGISVTVLEVLLPADGAVTTDKVFLRTTDHTNGAAYQVGYTTLYNSSGIVVTTSLTPYQARDTKSVQALKSLPSYLDHRIGSLVRNLLTSISLEDDRLGGSRRDLFPSDTLTPIAPFGVLLTESGDFIQTESGDNLQIE